MGKLKILNEKLIHDLASKIGGGGYNRYINKALEAARLVIMNRF